MRQWRDAGFEGTTIYNASLLNAALVCGSRSSRRRNLAGRSPPRADSGDGWHSLSPMVCSPHSEQP